MNRAVQLVTYHNIVILAHLVKGLLTPSSGVGYSPLWIPQETWIKVFRFCLVYKLCVVGALVLLNQTKLYDIINTYACIMNTVSGLVIASWSKMFVTPKHSKVLRSSMHRLQEFKENNENVKSITKKITGGNNKEKERLWWQTHLSNNQS